VLLSLVRLASLGRLPAGMLYMYFLKNEKNSTMLQQLAARNVLQQFELMLLVNQFLMLFGCKKKLE